MKVFIEEQQFKKWILLSLAILPIAGGAVPFILAQNEIPGFNSAGFWSIVLLLTAEAIALILLFSIKLRTKINEQGIYYQYFPNHFNERYISWHNIKECYLYKYKSTRKFGSHGYKKCYFGKKGLVMSIRGKYGIQIILKNEKKILIGTQKIEDAKRILSTYSFKFESDEKRN